MSATNSLAPRTVAIFCTMRGTGWQGDAPVDLSNVFRFFNVVEDEDAARLRALGYDVGSLSADDLVGFVDGARVQWYLCAAQGWNEITDAQAQTYMIRAQRDAAAHKRTPMFTKMDDQDLQYLGDDGTVSISPSGLVR